MNKRLDKDLLWALNDLESQIEMCDALHCDESLKQYRRFEVLIRRLAREAGYDLTVKDQQEAGKGEALTGNANV